MSTRHDQPQPQASTFEFACGVIAAFAGVVIFTDFALVPWPSREACQIVLAISLFVGGFAAVGYLAARAKRGAR